jgi:hypothetical protein
MSVMDIDLTQPAIVFWMRQSKFQPGRVTRFDHLEEAVNCVMQHWLAPSDPVAWIRTTNRHLDMDQIRGIGRSKGPKTHLGAFSYI